MNKPLKTLATVLIAAGQLAPTTARADSDDALSFSVAASYLRDDNLFHLAPDAHPQGLAAGRSDSVRTVELGVHLDKAWSLQHVLIDASTSRNNYANYTYLSYDAHNYRAAWQWQLTPRLTGTLSANREQSLVNYADFQNYTSRDVRTSEYRHFDASWWLQGSWNLVGGLSENYLHNSAANNQETNYRLHFAEAGARYVAESGSSVTLLGRSGHGSYPDVVPNASSHSDNYFRQKETELRVNWPITAHSTLDARVTHLARRHANYAERDFAGNAGSLKYTWQATAQLQIGLAASRSISSYQDLRLPFYNSSYVVDDKISLTPVWAFSGKATLRFNYDAGRRSFRGEVFPSMLPRRDTPRTFVAELDWSPTRTTTLGLSVQHERRGSTVPGFDYRDRRANLNAQVQF